MSESPIKVVHMWVSMAAVMATIVATGGGVIWSIATFKSDTGAEMKAIRTSVDTLAEGMKEVASQAKESRDFILQNKNNIEALRDQEPSSPRTPIFSRRRGPRPGVDEP